MSDRKPRSRARAAVTALALAVVLSVAPGFAASISIDADDQAAFHLAQTSGAPVVVAYENFAHPNNTNLNGTSTDDSTPLTWAALRGTWRAQGNQADSGTDTISTLALNTGGFNFSQGSTVFRGTATFWDGGLVLNSNAANTQFLSVEWTSNSSGSVELWAYNGGWSLLASATNLHVPLTSAPASIDLRVETTTTQVRVYVNGTLLITYNLSGAQQTLYKNATHQYFGILNYSDGATRHDNYHLDTP